MINRLFLLVVLIAAMPLKLYAQPEPSSAPLPAIGPANLADMVERVFPAVVNISTTQTIKGRVLNVPEMPDMGPGSPFEQFREFFDQMQPRGRDMERKATSLGSGFVIDQTGYIVTNNHVIADADQISAVFNDGTTLQAKIVGRDTKTDLALLKVDSLKPLAFVNLGDSDKVRVGDWIVAVGNPFGLGGTVTAGIISAKARDINAGPFDNFLQTDAAINSGNSGGPMFNLKGEVIGINTAIFSPSGGNVGIGFATPSDMAKSVVEQLKKTGKVRYAWLGVKIQNVTEEISQSLGLEKAYGALVAEVVAGGPADKAGIQAGDVIVEFDGQEVNQMRSVPRLVAHSAIGKEVKITIWRAGSKKTVKTTLTESKEQEQASYDAEVPDDEPQGKATASQKIMGMELSVITKELRAARNISSDVKGLLVLKVDRKSAAFERGIRPDDVIGKINEQDVTSVDGLKNRMEELRKQNRNFALLRVWRAGDSHFVTLPTSDKE